MLLVHFLHEMKEKVIWQIYSSDSLTLSSAFLK